MKLGLALMSFGNRASVNLELVKHAEAIGFNSVWTAEAYGGDAVTAATWILAQTTRIKVGTAIMQMPARTPAMAAMTAMSLDHLSGGRFILGLGPSGPQVVEGWHGLPYGKPLTRTKEYIQIIRQILAREAPLEFHGEMYDIPNTSKASSGLGKPLKSILHGNPQLPIYTAAISPAGLRCAAEVADGVFPMMYDPDKYDVLLKPFLEEGFASAVGEKSLDNFVVAPTTTVILHDNVDEAMALVKPHLALYIGGMGARDKNFYTEYAIRMGFEEQALRIQDLYLSGRKAEAIAAVPEELIDAVHLVGPAGRIKERLQAWKAAGQRKEVHTMIIGAQQPEALDLLAKEML